MTNKALGNYIALQSQIEAQLEVIKQKLEQAQNENSPEEINWGHVGDLNHISNKLSEITVVNSVLITPN